VGNSRIQQSTLGTWGKREHNCFSSSPEIPSSAEDRSLCPYWVWWTFQDICPLTSFKFQRDLFAC
jgi:hypothetical protein